MNIKKKLFILYNVKKINWKLGKVSILSNVIIAIMLVTLGFFCLSGNNAYTIASQKQNQPYYKGNTQKQQVALMINVYWGTEYLDEMLATMDEYGVKCTFFVGGSWVMDNKDMLKKISDKGHEIGNHGYFHKDHKGMNIPQNRIEICNCNKVVEEVIGKKMTLFAPPSGSFDKTTMEVAQSLDMKVIMWSKDTIDWRDKNENLVYSRATKNLQPGDLILAHPTAHTSRALKRIFEEYKKTGYTAVTVSQILQIDENKA